MACWADGNRLDDVDEERGAGMNCGGVNGEESLGEAVNKALGSRVDEVETPHVRRALGAESVSAIEVGQTHGSLAAAVALIWAVMVRLCLHAI